MCKLACSHVTWSLYREVGGNSSTFRGTARFQVPGIIHAFIGYWAPQSKHLVTANCAAQFGQRARVWKMSKGFPQRLHLQKAPTGGAALHAGQANPSWRGNLAIRNSARACFSPLQQFMRMNAAIMPNQADCRYTARAMSPATPTKPITVAAIKLRARPSTNQ